MMQYISAMLYKTVMYLNNMSQPRILLELSDRLLKRIKAHCFAQKLKLLFLHKSSGHITTIFKFLPLFTDAAVSPGKWGTSSMLSLPVYFHCCFPVPTALFSYSGCSVSRNWVLQYMSELSELFCFTKFPALVASLSSVIVYFTFLCFFSWILSSALLATLS